MKKLLLSIFILIGLFAFTSVEAQVRANISITNDHHPDYYYLPDVDMYYYIPGRQYVYFEDGRWIFSRHLPSRYHEYDFAHGRRIFVEGPNPYLHHQVYYNQYYGHGYEHRNGHNYNTGHGNEGHGGGHSNEH